jgi:long-chain acyl-CoA synthetase
MGSVEAHVIDEQDQRLAPGEQGELVISGPSVIPAYWRNTDATERAFVDGALRTGDGAVIDEEGWVFLVDRLKDQINTSGYKVWPREVEEVLLAVEGVREAAVVGVPDDYRGERVVAYVVTDPGAAPSEDEMQAFAPQAPCRLQGAARDPPGHVPADHCLGQGPATPVAGLIRGDGCPRGFLPI